MQLLASGDLKNYLNRVFNFLVARNLQVTRNEDIVKAKHSGINPEAAPSGTGCAECLAQDGWWFHLRRCAECGHIGCCDSSPAQHATAHHKETGHPVIASFEPGETWFWDYRTQGMTQGAKLTPPHAHPTSQPVPGPAGKVPRNWQSRLH